MTGDGTTVVLGWDGLDYELAARYGLADDFAPHHRSIEPFDNPALGEPSTYELWPSIITGASPDRHGVEVLDGDGRGAQLEHPLMNVVGRVLHAATSERTRAQIGLQLRNRGISFEQKTPRHYRRRGVTTVFDGRRARPVGIPNYRTHRDDELDVISGWGEEMARYLDITVADSGRGVVYQPTVPEQRLEEWLVGEANKKIGIVRVALDGDYDIVFTWLAMLDNVGHTVPAVDDDSWQERAYRYAADMTNEVREAVGDDGTVVVVSDHGHRQAHHTHDAYLGATDTAALEDVERVTGVRAGLERVTPNGGGESGAYEVDVQHAQ